MRAVPFLAALVLAIATSPAGASDVSVTYVVDGKAVRRALATTVWQFALYPDASCTTPLHTASIAAGDVDLLEVNTVRLRGPKPEPRARIAETLSGVTSTTSVAQLHLEVTGDGIVPLGAACQAQPAGLAAATPCPPDSVPVGTLCVDTYEASVWQVPTTNHALLAKIRLGIVTLADLTAAGATQLGCPYAPYGHAIFPTNFPPEGHWSPVPGNDPPSPGVYAVSIPGVRPSACLNQFRALQACALSGKRLIRNDEWQTAVVGTPDPGLLDDGTTTCSTNFTGLALTGARTACVSSWGVHDMVGNVWEWTGDWTDQNATGCASWSASAGVPGNDVSCFAGIEDSAEGHIPGVIIRGGHYYDVEGAGPLAIHSDYRPNDGDAGDVGMRCVR